MYNNNHNNNEEWFKLGNNEAETMCARLTIPYHSCDIGGGIIMYLYIINYRIAVYRFVDYGHVVDAAGLVYGVILYPSWSIIGLGQTCFPLCSLIFIFLGPRLCGRPANPFDIVSVRYFPLKHQQQW